MAYKKPLVLNSGLKQQIQDADTLDLRAAGIDALSATITTLGATSATITTLGATTANITTDNITTANITNLNFLTKNGILYAEAGVVDAYSTLPQDAGPLTEPSFTDNGDGTATIGSFDAFVYPSTDYTGILKKYTIAGVTLTFTADTEEYVVVDYNGGVPICRKETNKYLINGSSIFTVFICWRQDSTIHSITNAPFGYGLANKVHRYIYNTVSYRRSVDGGLIIAETTSPHARTITVTSSIVYAGITPIVVNPFDSSTHTFTRVNHVAGVWTYTHETYYDNSLYDNGTNAVAGTANRWVNRFFYRSIGDVREVFYTLGTIQHFNEDECHQELPPTPPLILRDHCIYIGFACIEVGATSGTMHPAFDFIEEVPDYVFYDSAGIFIIPSVSTGSGSITIGTGEYLLYNDGTYNSPTLNRYKITGGTFNPTSGITSYIVANYNSGTPIVEMITDVTPINQSDIIPIVTVFNDAGSIKYLLWDLMAQGLANKLSHRLVKTDRFRAEPNGFLITESTGRVVNITSGKIWYGATFVALDAIKSDVGGQEMTLYYHSAGVWTSTTITQYNNSQYDNGTNLVSLTPNKYAVNWLYRVLNQGSLQTLVVLGTSAYGTLAEASDSVPPSNLPALFTNFSLFVGRIIVKTSDPTASKIDTASTMVFSGITMHNGLSGLQGGDIDTSSFYHSDQAINTTDAPSFTDVTISDLNRDFAEFGFDTKWATGIPYSERIKFKVTFTYSAPNLIAALSFNSPYTSFSYYINGKKFTVTATEIGAYTASATAAEGIWFFYINQTTTSVAAPVMTLSQNAWVIYDPDVLLFNARFNASTNVITWIGEERHTAGRDIFNHARNHAQGAIYKEGFVLSTYNGLTALSSNTDNNTGRAQFQISNGKFFDEDIQITIQHADAAIASTTASPYYDWNLTIQQFLGFTALAIAGTDSNTIVFSATHTLVTGQAVTVMNGNTTTPRGSTTIQTGGTGTSFTVTPTVTGMTTGDAIVIGARIPIFYIDSVVGGVYTWRRLTTTTSFLGVSGGAAVDASNIASMVAQYNNPAGGWSTVTANRYYCVYLCATNLTSQPIVAIMGQSQSTGSILTTTLSESGWSFNNLVGLSYLSVQEIVPFYRLTFIYNTTGQFTNTRIKLVDASFINLRVATATGTVIGASGPTPTASIIPTDTTNFNGLLSATDTTVQKALDTLDDVAAADIPVDTTNFGNNLSAADDTVQKALDTLDDLVAGGGGGAGTTFSVSQTAHGFSVLTPIYFDAGIWKAAKANDMLRLATHVITEITSLDAFVAAQSGRFTVTGHGLTIETFYFVSATFAGALVATEPTTGFSNPVLFVEDANTIHVLPYRASEIYSTLTDTYAFHYNMPSEIHVLTSKDSPVDEDEFIIEDSEDSWNKKRVTRASLFSEPISNDLTVHSLTMGLGAGGVVNNIAFGYHALYTNTTGGLNIALGYTSLAANTIGSNNIAIGYATLAVNTTGQNNIAIGNATMTNNLFGDDNVAIGKNALSLNTTGFNNIAIGTEALYNNILGNHNIAIGSGAMQTNITGNNNVAIGESALSANITGNYNIAIGIYSLQNNLNDYNVAIGYNALKANTTGTFNVAVGYETLKANTIGNTNIAIGYQSLTANLTGRGNVAIGHYSLTSNTSGQYNIAVGPSALAGNTTGQYNIAVGYQALQQNTIGVQNVAVGMNTLVYNSTGVDNVAIGFQALDANTIGANNTAVGSGSLGANTTGIRNTAVGYYAMYSHTSGGGNVAIGYNAMNANLTGWYSVAIGYGAMQNNITGGGNVAIGINALSQYALSNSTAIGPYALAQNTTGEYNVAVGYYALNATTFGNRNVALGYQALRSNTTGVENTAVGYLTLEANTTGTYNTAVGGEALKTNTTGAGGTAIGRGALGAVTYGNNNTALGYLAGNTITTGSNLTTLGYNAQASAATATNEITLGDANVATLRCNTQTITALSDVRDKADINDFELGLNFINAFKVRKFHWDRREWYPDGVVDGSRKSDKWDVGLIAQEVQQVQKDFDADYLNMVLESNPDRLEVSNGKLLLPLVKAVQELSKQVEDLKAEIEILKKK